MILAVDVGNSNIVLGCLDESQIFFVSRISTDHKKTRDQYAVELKSVLSLYDTDPSHVTGAIISSVVPALSSVLCDAIELVFGVVSIVVGPGIKTGLNILIDNPAQTGSDLVVGAVAAIAEYKKPIMIIDMGTATTITVIDSRANFLGGAILPGVKISLDALTSSAAQLHGISLDAPPKTICTNTVECMRSGIVYGTCSMIDGMADRIAAELNEMPTIVATGGLSSLFAGHCRHNVIYDEHLMLKGLSLLYHKNRRAAPKPE